MRKARSVRRAIRTIFILGLLSATVFLLFRVANLRRNSGGAVVVADAVERTLLNYGGEVKHYAEEFKLPSSYFLSLIVLESSGRKVIPSRFEPHVYERLKEVKTGKRKSYEHVTPRHLTDATDDALKNLASSWGPFQLMGYKCLLMGIKVRDIRGPEAIYWGVKWIDLTYGKELRQGHYKNAFHIHNTGRKYPLIGKPFTHDPAYVDRGLSYMKRFEADTIPKVLPIGNQ